jgi:hypothetical protein
VNSPTEPITLQAIPSALGLTVELPAVSAPEIEETLHRDRESLVRAWPRVPVFADQEKLSEAPSGSVAATS